MSIERIKGCIAFVCDSCDEGFETEERDFAAAREAMAAEGWIVRRQGGEWKHFCSVACAKASPPA
jgi:hypothetical protein